MADLGAPPKEFVAALATIDAENDYQIRAWRLEAGAIWRAATAAAHEADAKLADLIDVDDCRDCDSVKVCCCGADAAFKIAKAIRSRAEEAK